MSVATRSPNSASLLPLFEPRSVALVGASPEFARYGGRALHFLSGFGFQGAIWPVNPKYKEIKGLPCYPDLRSLPGRPDHVGIVVAPEQVLTILKQCAEIGTKAVTVFTAGFGETGEAEGQALQREIGAFVREAGIRMLGPNCNGMINWKNRFSMSATAALLEPTARPGCVGVASQSGGLGQVNIMWRAIRAGLGISYQASCGNEADIDTLDVVEFLIDDPDTRVILMAVEGIKDGAKLRRVAAQALAAKKPILMLKLGRSAFGVAAAASHTGAMTGSDAVHDAAFEQLGILRVEDPQHLYHAAMLFQQGRPVQAEGVTSVAVSGGCLAVISDQAERFGLDFPEYSQETLDAIGKIVPSFITLRNPTDLSVEVLGKPGGLAYVLDSVAADPAIGVALPMLTSTPKRDLDILLDFARKCPKPTGIIWSGACNDGEYPEKECLIDGIPIFRDIDTGLRATGYLIRHARHLREAAARAPLVLPKGIDRAAARRVVTQAPGGMLTERESKQVLAAYGIPVTREYLARTADEAVGHWRTLGGPVALKIESPDIAHKTDIGGVRLGLQDEAAVRAAFSAIIAAARTAQPTATLNGVLVQQMAPPGVELIVGCAADPTYGPVVALGFGGIYAEFLGKPVLRLPPFSTEEARGMIDRLPNRRMLDGVRGRPAADVGTLAEIVARFSWLAADLADVVREIDVNPLMINGHAAVAVDGLVVRR